MLVSSFSRRPPSSFARTFLSSSAAVLDRSALGTVLMRSAMSCTSPLTETCRRRCPLCGPHLETYVLSMAPYLPQMSPLCISLLRSQ